VISSDRYPPFRVDVTVLFGKELSARGFSVDWLLQSQAACDEPYEAKWGGGIVRVGRTDLGDSRFRRLRRHWLGFQNDMRVRSLARKYDIVQVKDKVLAAMPALWAAKRGGAAFVYWLSFPHPEASLHLARIGEARYPMLYRIRGWVQFVVLYRYILPRADHVFVQSEQMKRDLVEYGIPAEKMTPVAMGVDLATFVEITEQAPVFQSDVPIVAYLGTLAGERRIDFLVRVMAHVLDRQPQARLLLVGDGDRPGDVEAILSEARRLGIDASVEVTGFLPQKEALQRTMAATVCVSPFYPTPILNSTSPTKLVEYMALSQPVVANDHPEQRLVLEQSGGGYCVPYDERAFADAILKVIADPVRAREMGRRGREYVSQHRSYKFLGQMLANKYREIAGMHTTEQTK
jgi:glycosyltransferase involved in cell wall biosynthesis